MANIKIYIPTFVSDQNFTPARVNPRVFFYNGTVDCEPFLIEANEGGNISQTSIPAFPYFDHYSLEPGGTQPGLQSNSLLFLNENAVYGTAPTGSLYSNYWEKYVGLLYDPKTRLLDASAIISLGDYNEMELNDIVQFRGNYFHLRAINEYDVKTGTCKIQLLGPILKDSLDISAPIICDFNFTARNYNEVEYLIVAGGGGGGYQHAGGGGAGGLISGSLNIDTTNYTVIVGKGGSGSATTNGTNGENSSVFGITALGGGGGGGLNSPNGNTGGSGGGAYGNDGALGGVATVGQGNDGADGLNYAGAGGGGASQEGLVGGNNFNNSSFSYGGAGGSGSLWVNGNFYAGGGGGGAYTSSPNGSPGDYGGAGGVGGGGNGGFADNVNPIDGTNGTPNTGGGGGGSARQGSVNGIGGNGGDGIVIIRYQGAQQATGGTITQIGGYTYHTFTTSGTFTKNNQPIPTTTTTTSTTSGGFYTWYLTTSGYVTANDACNGGAVSTVVYTDAIYNTTLSFSDGNTRFYTDSGLTTAFDGNGDYWGISDFNGGPPEVWGAIVGAGFLNSHGDCL